MTKRRNKKYQGPKPQSSIGGLHAIAKQVVRADPLPDERQTNVVIAYHTALDAMAGGYAQEVHFDSLVYAANIARLLAECGIGADYKALVHPALCAMKRCKERYLSTGKMGLDGDGMTAMKALAELHEAQLEIATQGELETCAKEMRRRVQSGLEFREEEVFA